MKNKLKWALGILCCAGIAGCSDSDDNGAWESPCGNGICESGESNQTCPQDCKNNLCGDGFCANDEDSSTCPADCYCGNSQCENTESSETCPQDCPVKVRCGDGKCDNQHGENRANCPSDCPPVCGDGLCEGGEYHDTCPQDCPDTDTPDQPYEPICGDGVCDTTYGETEQSCEKDCKVQDNIPRLLMNEFNNLQEPQYRFLFEYDMIANPEVNAKDGTLDKAATLENFFAFPYPHELRTDANGHPKLTGYPLPNMALLDTIGSLIPSIKTLIPSLVERVQTERAGFSPIGGVYFRTSEATEFKIPTPQETLEDNSCFQMINVEEGSKYYGERVPLYVTYHRTTTEVWAKNTLTLRPVPGVGPNPGDRYIAVVTDCLKTNGHKLAQSNKLRYILLNKAPLQIHNRTSYYVNQLDKLINDGKVGFKKSDIRAFTAYDTMDVANEMDQMATALKGKGRFITDEKGVAVGTWRTTGNVSIFRGQFVTANFIEGDYSQQQPSYTKAGSGVILFDEKGNLKSQPKEETIYFEVTVPQTAMPSKGYPIAVYGHGTGGDASTHTRSYNGEGTQLIKAGVPMAMIGFDACLQGNRTTGSGSEASLFMVMFQNPVVIRESVRQTVNDMLVLYDLLDAGKLILPPHGNVRTNTIFDTSYGLYMGHSQGSQEAGLLLGLTDSVQNAFLSAGGGGVLMSFVDLQPDLSALVDSLQAMFKGKSIADLLGMIFGLEDGAISYDTFITNHIVQPLMDPVDPLNFTPRFIKDPPEGMRSKNIAQTLGLGDRSTPQAGQFAMIASEGLEFVGKVYQTTDAIELAGLTKSAGNSVHNNITPSGGNKVTGGAIQFDYTGSDNPHFVIYDMASAKQAYIDFFKSVLNGSTTVSVTGNQSGAK